MIRLPKSLNYWSSNGRYAAATSQGCRGKIKKIGSQYSEVSKASFNNFYGLKVYTFYS